MSLPRLRATLDFMPSPRRDHPGLLIRDPFQFTDSVLIVPPQLVECLAFFDGEQSPLDLRAHLVRITGDVEAGNLEQHLHETLSQAGFLEDENFAARRHQSERAFAEAPVRMPQHAGSGYPDQPEELSKQFAEYMANAGGHTPADAGTTAAIAAPHVSPFGGIDSYRAAYSTLTPADAGRTFMVLGTSHYGEPDRFGLTRKAFATPFGETTPDLALVDELAQAAGGAAAMEDYCHAVEHSIEFQVVFLQHLFGPNIRVVPVLCGGFHRGMRPGGLPEADEKVKRMFDALGNIGAREGSRLLWVLGVDMAHMGRRYGDPFDALADRDAMAEVAERDRDRIAHMEAGDATGFWERVRENQDDLKWCGASPIYTFLRVMPQSRGTLRNYQQWNIDAESVVTFAGMRFQ
jgi:AmmeMemoRadiSam system protein B